MREIFLVIMAMFILIGCEEINKDLKFNLVVLDDDDNLKNCTKGLIPTNSFYKNIYEDCYENIIWVEILENDTLGEDLIVYTTPGPGFDVGRAPYNNIVQVVLPDNDLKKLDTLLNVEFYFNFRYATKDEYEYLLDDDCKDVYEEHSAPFIIITDYSFEDCNFNDVLP